MHWEIEIQITYGDSRERPEREDASPIRPTKQRKPSDSIAETEIGQDTLGWVG